MKAVPSAPCWAERWVDRHAWQGATQTGATGCAAGQVHEAAGELSRYAASTQAELGCFLTEVKAA